MATPAGGGRQTAPEEAEKQPQQTEDKGHPSSMPIFQNTASVKLIIGAESYNPKIVLPGQ